MTQSHDLTLYKHITELTQIISYLGVHVEVGANFPSFCERLERAAERHPVNPAFDPAYCSLEADQAFWMIGTNQQGELVHTQAVKLLDLQAGTLADYFGGRIWDFRSHGYDFDKARTEHFLSPEASRIAGRVTYHGEVWMKPGRGGYRSGSLVVLLTRLLLMKAMLRWSPDYMIGLQSPITSCRGLGIREGYMRTEQRTIVWYEQNGDCIEDWMVWMSGEDARFNLRLPCGIFYSLFKRNTEPELDLLQKQSA